MSAIEKIQFNEQGLIPVIAQDVNSGRVLMVAWMNREAFEQTQSRGEMVYYSRSRQALWHKGETSGHTQTVRELRIDCDQDVILAQVEQKGGVACHTGRESCFYSVLENDEWVATDDVKCSPDDMYGKNQ